MEKLLGKLIRVAHKNPETQPHLLPLIREAMEHNSPDALKKYLHEHPKADKAKHHVKKPGGKKPDESKEDLGETTKKSPAKDPKQPIKVNKQLGELLSQWHSSASDPIYAVSSNAIGGHEVPRETIQKALNKVDNLINYPDAYHVEPKDIKQLQKAKKIMDSMLS